MTRARVGDPDALVTEAITRMKRNSDVMRSDRLKQVMQEIDSSFDEKNLGHSKFSRFVQDASHKGLLRSTKTRERTARSGCGRSEDQRFPVSTSSAAVCPRYQSLPANMPSSPIVRAASVPIVNVTTVVVAVVVVVVVANASRAKAKCADDLHDTEAHGSDDTELDLTNTGEFATEDTAVATAPAATPSAPTPAVSTPPVFHAAVCTDVPSRRYTSFNASTRTGCARSAAAVW